MERCYWDWLWWKKNERRKKEERKKTKLSILSQNLYCECHAPVALRCFYSKPHVEWESRTVANYDFDCLNLPINIYLASVRSSNLKQIFFLLSSVIKGVEIHMIRCPGNCHTRFQEFYWSKLIVWVELYVGEIIW